MAGSDDNGPDRPARGAAVVATVSAAVAAFLAFLGALTAADTVVGWSTRAVFLTVCAGLTVAAIAGVIAWPGQRWTRLRAAVAGAAAVLGVAAAIVYFTTDDPVTANRINDVCVGPEAITSHEDTIWLGCVGTAGQGKIVKIDPVTHKVVGDPLPVRGKPHDLLVRGDYIWVFTYEGDLIELRTDGRETGRAIRQIVPKDNGGGDLVHDGLRSLWLNDWESGDVIRVDLRRFRRSRPFHVGTNATGLVYGAGSLWVTDSPGSKVVEMRDDGSVADQIDLPRGPNDKDADPQDIAVGLARVWIADYANKRLHSIDLDKEGRGKERLDERIYEDMGRASSGVATGGGDVWVSSADDDRVTAVDPDDHSKLVVAVGDEPVDVTIAGQAAWTADHKTNSVSWVELR